MSGRGPSPLGPIAPATPMIAEARCNRGETDCFGSQRLEVVAISAITRLEIHVASRYRTKPKHDVSRSHHNIVSHVVSLRAPRRKPKHSCNTDRDVDMDRARLFDILSDLIFALHGE